MLGLEARGSFASALGARGESVLRSGTKTLMNDPIRADFRLSYVDMSVRLRGEYRRRLALRQIGPQRGALYPVALRAIPTCATFVGGSIDAATAV